MLIVGGSLAWGNWRKPGRLAGHAILAFALLRLFADGFAADSRLLGSMRTSQMAALIAAAGLAFVLARTADREGHLQTAETSGEGLSPAEE